MAKAKTPKPIPVVVPTTVETEVKPQLKRLPPNSVKLMFAGEIVVAKNSVREGAGLFRRFEALFETLANMEKKPRIITYKFLTALMLTSHAKKLDSTDEKKKLFNLKNDLFLSLATDPALRRQLEFTYLTSPHFRVAEFCGDCRAKNEAEKLKRHEWKYCKRCKVDHNFYNVLAMVHKFPQGQVTLYLSNDLIPSLGNFPIKRKAKITDLKEEATFLNYHYNVQNLDAIELQSVLQWQAKLAKA